MTRPIPFVPSINAEYVKTQNCEIYVFGLKLQKTKKGADYQKFNLLILPGPVLVPGMRVVGKKIFPPQVVAYRKLITQVFLGKELREALESVFPGTSCEAAKFNTEFLMALESKELKIKEL